MLIDRAVFGIGVGPNLNVLAEVGVRDLVAGAPLQMRDRTVDRMRSKPSRTNVLDAVEFLLWIVSGDLVDDIGDVIDGE